MKQTATLTTTTATEATTATPANESTASDVKANVGPDLEQQLQQLKAKKNKSNLFLIKSYSFIERNNNSHSNSNNNNNNSSSAGLARSKASAKLSTVSAPPAELLQYSSMAPFTHIESLLLDQVANEALQSSRPKKLKKPKKKRKDKGEAMDEMTEAQLHSLLRRRPPAVIHEYEEMRQQAGNGTLPRPQSLPAKVHFELAEAQAPSKRESFIRQGLQSIRRSFGSSKQPPKLAGSEAATVNGGSNGSTHSGSTLSRASSCSTSSSSAHNCRLDEFLPTPVHAAGAQMQQPRALRSASSVSTLVNGTVANTDGRATISMASLQPPAARAANANATPTTTATGTAAILNEQEQNQRREQYCQQFSLPETFGPEVNPTKDQSLRHSDSNSLSPLVQVQPSGSVRSLASSSSHSHSSGGSAAGNGSNGSNTAKQHDQQTSGAAAMSSAPAAVAAAVAAAPPEKEKKRKEVSSSRVKKFHRHFTQVSKDEKLINYFSCALVSDILLQGHLYITDQHFAFYSNVFGYVTKVVIPTSSVTKISKEKTAKIIPNAVGVATADERHVFGSFISRESAFRLMCTVCSQLATPAEILPKPLPADIEISEEFFVEDDSSCSISGNESPPQLLDPTADQPATLRQRNSSNADKQIRHSDLPGKCCPSAELDVGGSAHAQVALRSSAPPGVHYEAPSISTSANVSAASSDPSSSSSPITVVGVAVMPAMTVPANPTNAPRPLDHGLRTFAQSLRSRLPLQLPLLTELRVLYLGVILAVLLALFSVFLLYRILDIEAKTGLYNTPVDFNWRAGNDEDIFAEALRWQRELQAKSTEEAQHILSKNLEQITKVRRSLETLSMLIHDRSNAHAYPVSDPDGQPNRDDTD